MNEQLDQMLKAFQDYTASYGYPINQEKHKRGLEIVKARIQELTIEAKIEQSYRCRDLIEANADSEEDEERYGEIVLMDIDDLKDELKETEK